MEDLKGISLCFSGVIYLILLGSAVMFQWGEYMVCLGSGLCLKRILYLVWLGSRFMFLLSEMSNLFYRLIFPPSFLSNYHILLFTRLYVSNVCNRYPVGLSVNYNKRHLTEPHVAL